MPGKIALISTLFAGAVAAAAYYSAGPSSEAPRAPASATSAPARANAPVDDDRTFRPEEGFRYTYRFRREVSFEGELGGSLPKVDFKGEFFADVLRADGGSFEAVLGERVEGAGSAARPLVRVEASARGDALEVFLVKDLNEIEKQHASILKDLAALWFFPLRSDTVGAFDARFDPEGPGRERKEKLAYLSKAPNTPTLLSSEHHLEWNPAIHLPGRVAGKESTRLGKGPTALVSSSAYELRFSGKARSPGFDHEALAALGERDALALDTQHPNMSEHPDYQHLDWGKLLADLRAMNGVKGDKQLALFGDVVKYLRLHPEKAGDLASLLLDPALLKEGAASTEFQNIVGALATAASPEALAALREAYSDPNLAGPGKGMILSSLTTTQAPIDAATREFLAQQMQQAPDPRLSQAAAFALGSALQNAPADAASRAAVALLAANLAASTTVPAQLAALDVIGNSGRADFVPALETIINGSGPAQLRARAVFALRFVSTAGAAQDLVSALASPDVAVRESAVNAMGTGSWNEAFRSPLSTCSVRETVARVQAGCAQILAANPQVAASK